MTLGEQIKQAREQKNLSQEELAERLSVSRQAISKWENNISVPQGINRELLTKVLELELAQDDANADKPAKRIKLFFWFIGWVCVTIVLVIFIMQKYKENKYMPNAKDEVYSRLDLDEREPILKSIRFYDSNMEEVVDEALWYNAAQINCILIQWDGSVPDSIKMFSTPSGSDILEETKLLLTKAMLYDENVALLSAEPMKDIVQGHVFFGLDYGNYIVTSDIYHIYYDSEMSNEN